MKFAMELAADLEGFGIKCQHSGKFVHNKKNLIGICLKNVEECMAFVAVQSDGYFDSEWCKKELQHAINLEKPLFHVIEQPHNETIIRDPTTPPELAEKYYYDLSNIPAYKEGVKTLAKDIKEVIKDRSKQRLTGLLLVALIFAVAGVLLLAHLSGKAGMAYVEPQIAASALDVIEITHPRESGSVQFRFGTGQGGLVTVSGRARGLPATSTILLTVAADDGIERPQVGGSPIHPDGSGVWTKEVQVGNAAFPPKPGDRFTLRAYVVTHREFMKYQSDNISGILTWPPEDNPSLSASVSRSFILKD